MLKYPSMRTELIGYVEDLADKDGRQATWETSGGELDEAVHFLYDDTPLSDDPQRALGVFLRDDCEVKAVRALIGALEVVFEQYGSDQGNHQVGAGPEWGVVKSRATALHDLLLRVPE